MRHLAFTSILVIASPTWAQPGECPEDLCGAPDQSGGGGGGGGGSILINMTDLGDTYQYSDDYDDDGLEDDFDNCPFTSNLDQTDTDGDGVGNACDVCPDMSDPDQADADADATGDVCDADADNDGILNAAPDNCLLIPNPTQANTDGDALGDACDTDDDDDGVPDADDNCPLVANPGQANEDPDIYGDACDNDYDGDLVMDSIDNCLLVVNPDQEDLDEDGLGDPCDSDMDGDGLSSLIDNCPAVPNPEREDADRDGRGDACDDYYCFVVDLESACLDPTAPFTVYGMERYRARTGEPLRLRLFANRRSVGIRYGWTIVEAPADSDAGIARPHGAVTFSTPFEYHYLENRAVEFTPDVPGEYVVELHGELAFEDELFPERRSSLARAHVIAEGPATDGGGCAMGRTGSRAAWIVPLALLLLGLGRGRRRITV